MFLRTDSTAAQQAFVRAGTFYVGVGNPREHLFAWSVDSESLVARLAHHFSLHLSRRFDEAVATAEVGLAISGRMRLVLASLATTFADWHKPEEADSS